MKRSGFKPKGRAPRPAKQIDYTPTPRTVATPAAGAVALAFRPAPKRVYVRSEALMALLRSQVLPCQHCGAADGTIVGAHSNWAVHGKGRNIKADDNRIAALCWVCHHQLDQGFLWSDDEKKAVWWLAHCKTVRSLLSLVLWPSAVPIPDIERCPWDLGVVPA